MLQPIVVLVHGTKPRGWIFPETRCRIGRRLGRPQPPLWFEEGSEFRAALRALLPESGVEFRAVRWSGANTFTARLEAGGRVREALREARAERPGSPLFVVAHSHGGTATMYALRGMEADEVQISGVATLATPYPYLSRRRLDSMQRGSLALLAVVCMGFLLNVILGWALDTLPGFVPKHQDAVVYLVMFGGALLLSRLLRRARRVRAFWRFQRIRWLRRVIVTPPHRLRLLALRAPGDEATLVLSAAQVISYLVQQVWRLGMLPMRACTRAGRRCKYALVTAVVLAMVVPLVNKAMGGSLRSDTPAFWIELALAGPIFAFFLPLFVSTVLIPPLFVVSALAMLPFGWEFVFAPLHVDATVEAVPPGAPRTLEIVESAEYWSTPGALRHSVHALPAVRRRLAEWMREGMGTAMG